MFERDRSAVSDRYLHRRWQILLHRVVQLNAAPLYHVRQQHASEHFANRANFVDGVTVGCDARALRGFAVRDDLRLSVLEDSDHKSDRETFLEQWAGQWIDLHP